MQSQPPGRKDKQRAVSVQWSCDLECCTGHHTEHDLQWRHKPAATSLLAKLWLWRSLEVCWSFHKGNCNCSWLLCCTMWWCAVWQVVVNICSCCLLLKGVQLSCTAWVESLNTCDNGRKRIDAVKNMFLCHCLTFLPPIANFLDVSLYNKPKVKFMPTTWNTTENNCII